MSKQWNGAWDNHYLAMRYIKRTLIAFALSLFLPLSVWAVPDQTMSITPTCSSGTTITCADNTSRMNAVSTPYNSHTHNDLTKTTANTFTIGDGLTGSKSIAISNNFTTAPSIRYNSTPGVWQFANDAATFLGMLGNVSDFTTNGFLYASGTQTLTSTAAATNGQLLIGSTGVAPVVAALTGTASQVTVTNGAGSVTLSLPQSIATTSSPTFAGLTDTGLTANSFLYSGTGGLLTTTIAPTNGQLLIGSTGAAPARATLTAGSNITITNGAGTITVAASAATPSVEVGTFTRDISLASGTQTVTITAGVTPKDIIFICNTGGGSTNSTWGFSNSTLDRSIFWQGATTADTWSNSSANSIHIEVSSGNTYDGDAGNFASGAFDVVWTKTGLPTGTCTCFYLIHQ